MLTGYKISEHLLNERTERVLQISKKIGFGEICFEFKRADKRYEGITTTGVLLVIAPDHKTIITMYPASREKASAIFCEKGQRIPDELFKIIKYNERFHII